MLLLCWWWSVVRLATPRGEGRKGYVAVCVSALPVSSDAEGASCRWYLASLFVLIHRTACVLLILYTGVFWWAYVLPCAVVYPVCPFCQVLSPRLIVRSGNFYRIRLGLYCTPCCRHCRFGNEGLSRYGGVGRREKYSVQRLSLTRKNG